MDLGYFGQKTYIYVYIGLKEFFFPVHFALFFWDKFSPSFSWKNCVLFVMNFFLIEKNKR